MAMIRLPVDATWVRRMAELADGPWTEEAVASAFTRYGWVPRDDGMPAPWWGPERADIFGAGDDGRLSGWIMAFEEAPPSEQDAGGGVVLPESRMSLYCGFFWPPLGEDDLEAGAGQDWEDGTDEYEAFILEPEGRRADFVAEYDRIGALVRDVLGEPTRTLRGTDGKIRAIWDRAVMALVLSINENFWDYSVNDVITLSVAPIESADDLDAY